MRYFWALIAYVTAIVVAVASCGGNKGTSDTSFTTGTSTGGQSSGANSGGANGAGGGTGNLGNTGGSTGALTVPDGGLDGGPCNAYKSCADQHLNCGNAGDGCGNIINCGNSCPADETCGGGGTQNVCGAPACNVMSCAAQNFNCGMATDGCNHTINCGTCPAGETCGVTSANQCGADGGVCTSKTCADLGATCGTQGDGCGNVINCGTCGSGSTCQGVSCVSNCTPKTCAQQGFNCGAATDGCGGVLSCGVCSGSQVCGGGGANICGSGTACTGGLCKQQVTCSGSATTSISGTVYAPNGVDPLPNTLVYVPNLGTAGLTTWTDGVATPHCDCSADISGDPLVSAVTDYRGMFTITDMPAGTNIPVVIQNGRWRRVVTLPNVPMCVNTAVAKGTLQMPSTQHESTQWDNIPLMGFVTGSVDGLECALRKIGIADSQFTNPSGTGRVKMYLGNGSPGAQINKTTPKESTLWGTQAEINAYDMVYFACQGDQYDQTTAAQTNVINYANAGGRVFSTHYSYVWLYDDAPFSQTATWNVNQTPNFTSDPETGYINQTFPAGQTLAQWLQYIGASTTTGQIPVNTLRDDFTAITAPAQNWVYLNDPNYPAMKPMHYTFDTPWMAASNALCGKVLFDDFHVEDIEDNPSTGVTFPAECVQTCELEFGFGFCSGSENECTTDADCNVFTPQEKMLEYFIFNLGGCVQPPTACVPTTCAAQNIACGIAADGCGNILPSCGTCPSGESCVSGTCVQLCTPKTCAQQGFSCGDQGDGCGNEIMCGTCPSGQTCSNGTCQSGTCTPKTCAEENVMCGSIGDTCGNIINCGTCPAGEVCGGKTPGQCYKPPCTPATCTSLGYNCGSAPDGCGNTLNCGTCTGGQVCGGGTPPKANVCGGGAN